MAILIDFDFVSYTAAGAINAGGTVTFYDTGTTTLKAVYSDAALTTPLSNPYTLDSAGRFTGPVYAPDGERYAILESTSGAASIRTRDPVWGSVEEPVDSSYTPSHTGAVSRTVLSKLDEDISLDDFGVVGDGVTDDSAKIQAAIDAAEAAGGGVIEFGAKTYAIASTLIVENDNVFLKGLGRGEILNSKFYSRASAATRLLWAGTAGGTMLKFTSDSVNGGGETKKSGGGTSGICLDGNESAGIGFIIESWEYGNFEFSTCYFTDHHWRFDVLSNGLTIGPADTQNNIVDILSHDIITASEPTTLGILHGDSVANTSLNYFRKLVLSAESTAIALELGGCDGNYFGFVRAGTRATASGNGGRVILHADDTISTVPSTGGFARQNTFSFIEARNGIYSKNTVAGSDPAEHNVILSCSGGNGAPFPTVEPGSTLNIGYHNGVTRNSRGASIAKFQVHRPNATFNQAIGDYAFLSENDAGEPITYSRMSSRVYDETDGTEDGGFDFFTMQSGTEYRAAYLYRGLVSGYTAGGGDEGIGTINAENGIYSGGIPWFSGSGSPESSVTAPIGALYSRTDGGASTTLYVKESGTGNTGWVAK